MNDGKAQGATERTITPAEAWQTLDALTEIIARAAAATLAKPLSEIERRTKSDQSPVTIADEASEAVILEGLARVLPGVPVVSEESVAQAPHEISASCVIVDPLDGTKEFLAGRDEFTVNIGIVTHGKPIAGVIAAPAQGLVWRGAVGHGAERLRLAWDKPVEQASDRIPIHTRPAPPRLKVALSRSHLDATTEAFLKRLPAIERYQCGSSVKFCHLAEGTVDLYPRLAPTREWDLAAGCAILEAAGGRVTDPDGAPLQFGNVAQNFLVPGFIAWGDPAKAAVFPGAAQG